MSSQGEADERERDRTGREALGRLEEKVGELLEELSELREQVRRSERRARVLEEEMRGLVDGDSEPGMLVDRVQVLEDRNRDLTERLEQGRAGIERLLARIRFLEEQAS